LKCHEKKSVHPFEQRAFEQYKERRQMPYGLLNFNVSNKQPILKVLTSVPYAVATTKIKIKVIFHFLIYKILKKKLSFKL
jgi:hypothetical protein